MARKILLADDSVTAQNMGRRILADAGYEVTTVNNGSAALKRIAESKPDLIVLDVYMPGYGGLEVCQRLRESDDTARIPVLLTVGKLEPFKVDEVRRVRADAFIIKPFEASELLTALTKLEDKIVPTAQTRKPGRIPKPGTSVDEFMSTAREYGDSETGWKNRLRIPPPHRKSQPEFPEPEPDRPRESQPHPEPRQEHQQPATEREGGKAKESASDSVAANAVAQTSVSFPPDITAEEIAAIQAAAAAFTTPSQSAAQPLPEVEAERETPAESSEGKPVAEPEKPAAQPASESQPETVPSVPLEAVNAQPAADSAVPVEATAAGQTEKAASVPAATDAVAVPENSGGDAPEKIALDQNKLAEHEVAAVLASLEFVNGTSADEPDEPLFATIAAAPTREEPTGPRWVATSVPLTEEESSLVLEQEMQKALCAMAELSAATPSSPETVAAAATENLEPPAQTTRDTSEARLEEPAPATSVDQPPSSPEPLEAIASTAAAEPAALEEQAAYAAAASSGSATADTTVSVEAVSAAMTPESTPSTRISQPQSDSELASAWASWKQIRESVVSPQITSQIADNTTAAAPSAESQSPNTAATDSASADPEAAGSGDDTAIASIVDNVLAELKPKLMQEIAKKMGKPKKRR